MSADVVFWGLTKTDFSDCFTNDTYIAATFFGAAVTAGVVAYVARAVMTEKDSDGPNLQNKAISAGIGAVVGIVACVVIANHFNPNNFATEKAMKFAFITFAGTPTFVGPFITLGGALGPFGRVPLYYLGALGAITGSLYTGMGK